ncbi:MAG TPA: hypothetical protein VHI93_06720 [Candidatus Thermoplasmatota archaeon]|nr:hypothetical protein [Candidatus Thermoplasmatota archaeon]
MDAGMRRALTRYGQAFGWTATAITMAAFFLPFVPLAAWCAVLGLASAPIGWWALRPEPAPPPTDVHDVLFDPEAAGSAIAVPATHDLIDACAEYARVSYGSDAIPAGILKAWWRRNPWTFLVLQGPHGEYLGHANLMPLDAAGARLIQDGQILEKELPAERILPPLRMREAQTLYLSALGVKDANTKAGHRRACQLIGALVAYVRQVYGTAPRTLTAIAASEDGTRLLRRLGARITCAAAARKDRHDHYAVTIGEATFAMFKVDGPARLSLRLPWDAAPEPAPPVAQPAGA